MGRRIAARDWSGSAVGPIAGWPTSLRAAVSLLLRSPVGMVLLWGEAGTMIYNDAYAAFAGGRQLSQLGVAVRDAWPEVVDFNEHVMRTGLAGGTLQFKDQELTLYRQPGQPERVWMDLYFSPVLDDQAQPGGVLAMVVETTAKVAADRWLQNEAERLRAMFEHAPNFIAMTSGPEHRYEFVNPAYSAVVGERSLIGLSVREAFPELDGQGFFELLDQVYATGVRKQVPTIQATLSRGADGALERRFVEFVAEPMRDAAGEVRAIMVIGSDITERMESEEALRLSEARFRGFAQAMPNQVWTATPDGQLDWFNDRTLMELGATTAELAGDGWTDIIHPDDRQATVRLWQAALAAGTNYEAQARIGSGGGWRWHITRATAMRDEAGATTCWIGTNTDIHGQKTAEAALERLNANLSEAVAARTAERDRMWRLSTDLMIVLDGELRIVAVNPAWGRLLGWSFDQLAGRLLLEFLHPLDHDAALAEAGRVLTGTSAQRFEGRFSTKNGDWRLLSWTAVAEAGLIHGVGRDMTAERVAARALADSQATLQQAQKMEAVGKLTGGVAHDFNNLLQVISGNLELLAEEAGQDGRPRQLVSQAMDAVGRGARLANQLLAYARRQPLAPKVVNAGRLIRNMDDLLRRTLGGTVEVETVIADGLWNCMVDPVQIETAVLNLAINARDAMATGGRLTIEANNASLDDAYVREHEELRQGQYVMLAVTDTGTGMEASVIEQAFEPFFSTKPEGRGTGLGLSMVYGFVKQSGGHVKIYSEVGHGTTVKLYLPRSAQSEDVEVRRLEGPVEGGRETILVAEDDTEVLATVVAMLGGLGYRVLTARDAASAMVMIESGAAITLLFTDVVMPGPMRSPELARWVRQRSPHIAVLFTSGYTDNAIVHGGRLDEGVELLSKPYSRDALARKVREVLNAAAKLSAPPTTARRVLLVEDDPIIRMGSASLLKRLGHIVVSAAHAEQALRLIETDPPFDVLFTDIGLPGMRGDALAARIRERFPNMPVVFATGYNDAPQINGRVAFVAKPFGRAEVERAMAEVLA